jgi:hypothetical protein
MFRSDGKKKHGGLLQPWPEQTAAFFALTISASE